MDRFKDTLIAGAILPVLAGAGLSIGGVVMCAPRARAASATDTLSAPLPTAKPRPGGIQVAACNPCSAGSERVPCAAKSPCNPCSAANPCAATPSCNPCNPCAAGNGGVSDTCIVPRLQEAAGTRNPCAAKNPCNPCAPASRCNPCAAGEIAEITSEEARDVYECLQGDMAAVYARAEVEQVEGYTDWRNLAKAPYQSATHGSRYVNNFANAVGAPSYAKFEEVGIMPAGSVLAKDSFIVNTDGTVAVGPLFVMEKMKSGFNGDSRDWKYTMIMPTGAVFGITGGKNSDGMTFCYQCHITAEDTDTLMFMPEDMRAAQ